VKSKGIYKEIGNGTLSSDGVPRSYPNFLTAFERGVLYLMSTNDNICKGCLAHQDIGWYFECILEPTINNKQCPCLTCVVKVVCEKDDTECQMYSDYAIEHLKEYQKENPPYSISDTTEEPHEPIPCATCKELTTCINKIKELYKECYGEDIIDSEQGDSFHTDILDKLTNECETLYKYFPFEHRSRDGLLGNPNDYFRHNKITAMGFKSIPQEEWDKRNRCLNWFFQDYYEVEG